MNAMYNLLLAVLLSVFAELINAGGVTWPAIAVDTAVSYILEMLISVFLPFTDWGHKAALKRAKPGTPKFRFITAGVTSIPYATLMSAAKSRYGKSGVVWAAVLAASVFFLRDTFWGYAVQAGSIALALRILYSADGFSFFHQGKERRRPLRTHRTHSVLRYFFRYLWFHKNYLVNTGIMWGAACVLPLLFRQAGGSFMIPVGFAVLSLNTPLCILLSCDPALEQAVRFLPGQRKAFCVPYVLFLFLCNLAADSIFLISWQLQAGNISAGMAAAGLGFAFLSAVLSVLLEWFFPIRGWKIESDLWHHPRKYLVPGVMLLLAGILAF